MLTKKNDLKGETKPNKNGKSPKKSSKSSAQEPMNSSKMPPAKAPNQLPAKNDPSLTLAKQTELAFEKKPGLKTQITIKYDVGFPNQLYIRGKGANLSWDKGQPFRNVKPDEWIWETDAVFSQCEFKVLINDRVYESGENHFLHHGAEIVYSPRFY